MRTKHGGKYWGKGWIHCATCGREFYRSPIRTEITVCSRACRPNGQPDITKSCPICEREFSVPYKQRRIIYCSRACAYKGRKTRLNQIPLKCDNCGREFSRSPALLKSHGKNHRHCFCSKKCYAFFMRQYTKGKRNANWRGGISSTKNNAAKGKGNRLYKIGTYFERKARKELEADGYYVVRSAASKGIWDLVAIKSDSIKLVQVKVRSSAISKDRTLIESFTCPQNVSKELWR